MGASPMVVRHLSPVGCPLLPILPLHISQIHDGLLPRPCGLPPILRVRQGRRPAALQISLPSEHVHGHACQHGMVRLRARTPDWIVGTVGSGGDQRRVYDFGDCNVCGIYHAHRVEVCV